MVPNSNKICCGLWWRIAYAYVVGAWRMRIFHAMSACGSRAAFEDSVAAVMLCHNSHCLQRTKSTGDSEHSIAHQT